MWTSVYRDILDKSISGDKIFGGSINWVDALYADALVIPHDGGAGGNGSINGENFAIGNVDPIFKVTAKNFTLDAGTAGIGTFYGRSNSLNKIIFGLSAHKVQFYLKTTGAVDSVKLNPDDSFNYIATRIAIGGNVDTYSAAKLQVNGFTYSTKFYTQYCYMDASNVFARNVYFDFQVGPKVWASDWYTQYLAIKTKVDAYASNLNLITSSMITNALQYLTFSVNANSWEYLSLLDQDVGVDSSPQFGEFYCTNVVSANYDLEGVGDNIDQSVKTDAMPSFANVISEHYNLENVGDRVAYIEDHYDREWKTDTLTIMGGTDILQTNEKTVSVIYGGDPALPWNDLDLDDLVVVLRRQGGAGWLATGSAGVVLTGIVTASHTIKIGICPIVADYTPNANDKITVRTIRKIP